jgi:hypothetical protein
MGMGEYTEDQLDLIISGGELAIATIRSAQMAAIHEKKRRQSHHADGYRSIVDWVAARADVSHQTARSLCWTASRLEEAPEVEEQLASCEITFDRAEQLARLPESAREDHEGYDIAQLRRLVAHHRRLSPKREREILGSGYVHFQPALDETTTHFWGELAGLDARLVEKAIDQRADEVLADDVPLAVAERRALALVAICQDSLYSSEGEDSPAPPVDIAVTVNARTAAPSDCESGVAVLAGPRIGRLALEEILCNGTVEVIGISETGTPLSLGRRTRTVSRKLRRHVLARDGCCTVEGCPSHYRLEVHHSVPWSRGGRTDADHLVTLCWFHHHVAVHRLGLELIRVGRSRVRLKRPG